MTEERRQILDMLANGKITAEEAEKLLDAIGAESKSESAGGSRPKPKFLHVQVERKNGHSEKPVHIRVPLALVKAGMKLHSVLPGKTHGRFMGALHEKGIDLDNLDSGSLNELIAALTETSIDVDDEKETVRIYCA